MNERYDTCAFCHRQALIVEALKNRIRELEVELKAARSKKSRNAPAASAA